VPRKVYRPASSPQIRPPRPTSVPARSSPPKPPS
jgi:hypothetical protein